jgi:hypothetical protein
VQDLEERNGHRHATTQVNMDMSADYEHLAALAHLITSSPRSISSPANSVSLNRDSTENSEEPHKCRAQ